MLNREKGAVLIGLMVALMIAAGFLFLRQANQQSIGRERNTADTAALQQAVEALLARAVSDANRPGSLPCPALTSDGLAQMPPCMTYIGWFPWRTLGLPDLRDRSGERMWYVLSPAFQDSGTITSNSISGLTLDGVSGIAALVIAPGPSLTGQNRPSNNATDYLDAKDGNPNTSNTDGDNSYFSGPSSNFFNDRTLALSTSALFAAVSRRVLNEIRFAYAAAGITTPPSAIAIGSNSSAFPYTDPAFASINSSSWYSASPPFHLWYESLANNNWFQWVVYSQANKSISLNGQTQKIP